MIPRKIPPMIAVPKPDISIGVKKAVSPKITPLITNENNPMVKQVIGKEMN